MAAAKRVSAKRLKGEPEHFRRRCIACRTSDAKEKLLRFVLQDRAVVIDSDGNLPGRGAYIHPSHSCWAKMGERGMWEHAFRCGKGVLGQSDWVGLREKVFKIVEMNESLGL